MRKTTKIVVGLVAGAATACLVLAMILSLVKSGYEKNGKQYISARDAGKEIAQLQTEAYSSKKKVTITIKFMTDSLDDYTKEAYLNAAKEQFGSEYVYDLDDEREVKPGYAFNGMKASVCYCDDSCDWRFNETKKGVYDSVFSIDGANKEFRKQYENDEARKA